MPESDTALAAMSLEHPEWIPAFDIEPERAADSRWRIFNWADGREDAGLRLPFPALPRPRSRGRGGAGLAVAADC